MLIKRSFEVHLCGEASAIDIVKKLLDETGEHVEVRNYDRMSKLDIRNHALGSLDKLQASYTYALKERNILFLEQCEF